ncbi:MAG: right-handed parallel beta-helix repeat-containing protein [Planctomycetota bacterium]
MNRLPIIALLLVWPGRFAAGQVTWYVDHANCPGGSGTVADPFCQIQDAIAAAADGDTVLVLPGTYLENLDFLGKGIELASRDGAPATVIDGGRIGRVVRMEPHPGVRAVLRGFTITNGHVGFTEIAAGVLGNGSGTIADNIVTDSRSDNFGGGITCYGDWLIEHNVVQGNSAQWGTGGIHASGTSRVIANHVRDNGGGAGTGGISAADSTEVVGNAVVHNGSAFGTGGISCSGLTLVDGNVIRGNSLYDGMAAGVQCWDACTIRNNLIAGNDTGGEGLVGGILANQFTGVIEQNAIIANVDGGISCYGGTPTIRNNLIAGNLGAGVEADQVPALTMTSNTIVRNRVSGGAIRLSRSTATVSNTICWDNSPGSDYEILLTAGDSSSTLIIDYGDLEGGASAVLVGDGCTLLYGNAMIDQDPRFVAPGPLHAVTSMHQVLPDYHLSRWSPCINRGTNAGAPNGDLDGDARPAAGTSDIGADEFVATHALSADRFTLSRATGGRVVFTLDAEPTRRGQDYVMLAAVSGTNPGTTLPGGAILPLNWDSFTSFMVRFLDSAVFVDFADRLDAAGRHLAAFDTLGPMPPEAEGLTFSFAYALAGSWQVVSNPIGVSIGP